MNELQIVNRQEVLGKDFKIYGSVENPLFLAKDVAEWIDYDVSKSARLTECVDDDEKVRRGVSTQGGVQEQLLVTEDGLYEILMQSRKPIAKEFKKEVKKILKQIRLTGGAVTENRELEFINNYFPTFSEETKLAMVQDLYEQNCKFKAQIENQRNEIKLLEPKGEFYDAVTDSKTAIEMSAVAKLLDYKGIGRNRLFDILRANEILRPNNEPYQSYIDKGWFRVIESKYTKQTGDVSISLKTLVLQKGIDGIRRLLKSKC